MVRRLKEILFLGVGMAIFFIVTFLIGSLSNEPEWAVKMFVFGILIVPSTYFLVIIFQQFNKKEKFRNDLSLYQWMDDLSDYDENLVFSLKRYGLKYGTLDNLNNLKKMLLKQTSNDKSTLKMYRIFYNQKLKESGEELYLRTIMIAIIPAVIMLSGQGIYKLEPIVLMLPAAITFLLIAFISIQLSLNKRRYGVLVEMIDLCIEEIEDEENQAKGKKSHKKEEGEL